MKVAAIIVTYNGKDYIRKCLSSLYENSIVSSIIIVDNLSTDNTVDILKNHFPNVIVIISESNIGFGKANNKGIVRALQDGADYVFLINQDAYVEREGISNLVEIFEKNKQYGIIAPVQLNGTGDNIDIKFYDYLFNQNKEIGYRLYNQEKSGVYPVAFVNAAAWLISRECIEKVGGFDPIFFHTGEDDDYAQRVKYWQYKIGIAPSVHVRHDRPQVAWSSSAPTVKREVTLNILGLKNIHDSLSRNFKKLFRKKFFYIFYSLITFNVKKLKLDITALSLSLKMIPVIKESRKISYRKFAFLDGY